MLPDCEMCMARLERVIKKHQSQTIAYELSRLRESGRFLTDKAL